MKTSKSGKLKLSEAQNLVRGALALLRANSTPECKREGWRQAQSSQRQINKAISKAKRELNPSDFADFEAWLAQQIGAQFPKRLRLGTQLTALGLFPSEIKSRNLASELSSCTEKLINLSEQLFSFGRRCKTLTSSIRNLHWELASEQLKEIEAEQGHSYWSIETSLALIQASKGMESTKAEIKALSISSFGITTFLLYHFGVRNEPAQNSARYRANTGRRIEDADLSKELASYVKFRLYGFLGYHDADIADVLTCEQLTTPTDLLFTLVKTIRHVLEHRDFFSPSTLKAAAESANRIQSVIEIIGINTPKLDIATNLLVSEPDKNRLTQYARAAIKLAFESTNVPDSRGIISMIEEGLASQISTRSDGLHAEELAKFILNLGWLPECIELGNISTTPPLPKLLTNFNIETDYKTDATISVVGAINYEFAKSIANPDYAHPQIRYLNDILSGNIDNNKDENISTPEYHPLTKDCKAVLTSKLLYEQGEIEKCITLCAKTGIENDKLISSLPVLELIQGAKWPSISSMAPPFYLSIVLDHYLRIIDERKIRTYKRYAVEELMKQHECSTVVELPMKLNSIGIRVSEIEFLVANVCDSVTIELFPGMSDSRKERQTRYQLLMEISKLHTENRPSYLRDAEEIQDRLKVDDGLDVLDDSKVYVDEQAILNTINQELTADFQRYLKLVESGVGESESLADVIKSFRAPTAKNFQIPKNDADDLLAELIGAMREKFLFDPAFGLDILIGRRIRHGTIASEIRGVLERAELIGQRPSARSNYDLPHKIKNFCQRLEPKQRKFIAAAFSRFAESIDGLIALLRDEYFHVKSKAKSRGIFDLVLTPSSLMLFRVVAQSCKTIDQFSKECLAQFWYELSLRSEAIKPTIEVETKKTLQSVFSKLTDELRAQGVMDAAILSDIQLQSEELQRRAFIISSWIRVPQVSVEGQTFSMQYTLDVAVAVVTGQHAKFSPIVTSSVPDWMFLETHGFSIVEDALYIALVNIYEHSGKKVNNKIHVDIGFDPESSLARFTITNEIAVNYRTSEKEAKLNSTRLDIKRRAHRERARQDRGSGLCKLATIVMQSDKASINFGFVDDSTFKLEFDLVYIPPKSPLKTPPEQIDLFQTALA